MENAAFLIGHLAEQAGCGAEWRQKKAEEYPDDERNAAAAAELSALAEGLGSLNPQTPLVQRYAQLVELTSGGIEPSESEIFGRVGFDYFFSGAEDFLKSVIEEYESQLERA